MATRALSGVPNWLLDCKESITRSKEWDYFIDELHDAVEQQLTESHVKAFTDLTDAERALFLDRAARAIKDGEAYDIVKKTVSRLMDQYLNNSVSKQLMEEENTSKTKSDLILYGAQDGILSLLMMWPDLKFKLHACFNNPLPTELRRLAWKLFLENPKVRKQYIAVLDTDPRKAISSHDYEISGYCEHILTTEPTLGNFKESVGAFYAMKAMVSYEHAVEGSPIPPPEEKYLLTIPLICAQTTSIPRKEPAMDSVVALLVEQYFSILASRPTFMVPNGTQDFNESMKSFAEKVSNHLLKRSPDTAQLITTVFKSDPDQIVATETGTLAIISDAVISFLGSAICSLFVGYLPLDTVQFLWDQYILGMDRPGFLDVYLPAVATAHVMLLKDKLKDCSSPSIFESTFKKESASLRPTQFQYQISQHFYDELHGLLTEEDRSSIPVLDPTQVKPDPWSHWHKDRLPPRTGPDERRKARQTREEERQRQLEDYKNREQARAAEEQRQKVLRQQEALAKTARDQQQIAEERRNIYDELEKERQMRIEAERRAAEQIDRLRAEIDNLAQRQSLKSGKSIGSVGSSNPGPVVPPASRATKSPSIQLVPTPHPVPAPRKSITPKPTTPAPEEQTSEALLNFMRRVSAGFDTVAHGNAEEKEELDKKTRDYYKGV